MTRTEFEETMNNFADLMDFCRENNLYTLEYFIDGYDLDEYINGRMLDMARYDDWKEIRDYLQSIEDGYDWYNIEYSPEGWTDEDAFNEYYDKVLNEAEEDELFDDEEVEELMLEDEVEVPDIDYNPHIKSDISPDMFNSILFVQEAVHGAC